MILKRRFVLLVLILFLVIIPIHAQTPPPSPSLTLTWTNSANGGVTGYNLYRSETAGGPYVLVNAEVIPSDPSGTGEWIDLTAEYNHRYYYVCRAVIEWNDPAGDSGILESVNSNEATEYNMPPDPEPLNDLDVKKTVNQ